MKFIHGDRFRFLPMEDISYSTTLGEVFLCSSVFLTCFYHDNVIMHPISSCFGIFSLSKACSSALACVSEFHKAALLSSADSIYRLKSLQPFMILCNYRIKWIFVFCFFPEGFFNCPIWFKLCKILHERIVMLSPCQSEFACQEWVQCWNNVTARQLTFMLPDPFHTHTIK